MRGCATAQGRTDCYGRDVTWDDQVLDAMISDATVDCYGDSECVTGFLTALEQHLDVPFSASVLGVETTVTDIELSDDDRVVAVCQRDQNQQRISLLDLQVPMSDEFEWIEAYRRWAR